MSGLLIIIYLKHKQYRNEFQTRTCMVKYFRVYRNFYYILKFRENLHKFDSQSDKGSFLDTHNIAKPIKSTTYDLKLS